MTKTKVLTGITPSGSPHLGNYIGAIKPAISQSLRNDVKSYYFLADYHSLVKNTEPKRVHQASKEIAATWLALGLDTKSVTFYRQSDIPEIMELTWILNCVTAKGLMNRAHAYKAAVQSNTENEVKDSDNGISMGLFCYTILMSADILIFNADKVPVGRDQLQHIEMTRDIAAKMNHRYQTAFSLPEAQINDNCATIAGLDGRKMSKSYNNTIPIFSPENTLLKLIRKIKTNSLLPGEPKVFTNDTLFQIYSAVATDKDITAKKKQYEIGASWGTLKDELYEYLNNHLTPYRENYNRLMADPHYLETELKRGAEKARFEVAAHMAQIRSKVGIGNFSL